MTALVLDAGALIAVDRDDRAMAARLRIALDDGIDLRTHAMVIAQVWRDPLGRQANLARLLRAVEVREVDAGLGKSAGVLCGSSGVDDPIDAAVALITGRGDAVVTSDPGDIATLLATAGTTASVIPA